MPAKSAAQERLMQAAAHTSGGYGGVSQKVGKEFVGDSGPRTLYVNRAMKNAGPFLEWAKSQGFTQPLPADDIHVTIAFSKTPLDWSKFSPDSSDLSIPAGGSRIIKALGDEGATTLKFDAPALAKRWQEFRDAGASWDWPEYQPHVTITYFGSDVDLSKVTPYDGPLEFGPEKFAEVDEDWADKVKIKTASDTFALDRNPENRIKDIDGHLHVKESNISKANVCPYRGEEIPNYRRLGLEPDRIYQLLRDPAELEKAAPTFNGKPLLIIHKATSATDHPRQLTVGAVKNSRWEAPYIKAELDVWDGEGISGIEDETQKELSSGYRYKCVLEPGIYEGLHFDGKMVDIVGNHVALVTEGRAGSDVVVGDSAENLQMNKIVLTRKAAVINGALLALVSPKMAADKKIDFGPVLKGITHKNFKEKRTELLASIATLAKPLLAKDASIESKDLEKILDIMEMVQPSEGVDTDPNSGLPMSALPVKKVEDEDLEDEGTMDEGPIREYAKSKGWADDDVTEMLGMMKPKKAEDAEESEEEKKAREKKEAEAKAAKDKGAKDEPPPFKGRPNPGGKIDDSAKDKDMVTTKAMDAALKAMAATTEKRVLETQRGIRAAETECRPYIGATIAMDSATCAEDVYRTTLVALGEDEAAMKDLPLVALKSILKHIPKPGEKKPTTPHIAMDAAAASGFAGRYPDAMKIDIRA